MSDIDQRIERLRERYTPRRYANHYSHGDPDVLAVCAEVERLNELQKAWCLAFNEAERRAGLDSLACVPDSAFPLHEKIDAMRAELAESIARQGAEEIDRLEQIVSSQVAEVERLRAAADKIRLFAQSALYWYASAGSQRVASTPRINHSGATWILRMIRDSEEKPPEGIDQQEEAT